MTAIALQPVQAFGDSGGGVLERAAGRRGAVASPVWGGSRIALYDARQLFGVDRIPYFANDSFA
jgi:hypothetical protein